ncbi:hypothetical protein TNIN_312491 [Trichonephila inaurata madagascariensis]|uniref:Retrotransposon gag domain-containing protein n=1 Tax=Trichonephila inaurata madagascariensis TaxID=2747483 RepID=A0A8X6YIT8_9ARAC|nr:hypothetical protein TNIN_312491 [Trichonephila inaurata madagascariensis]
MFISFLGGTVRAVKGYVNSEDALDSWEAFKNGLSGLFGDRQKYSRRAEEQLKCRAQRSGSKRSFKTKLKRFWPQCQQKPTETRPRPTCAAVTRKSEFLFRDSHLNQKNVCGERLTTDLFPLRTSWTCNALLPREKSCLLTIIRAADRTSTTLTLKNSSTKLRSPFYASPRGRSPTRRFRSPSPYRRSSQSPSRRREEN